MPRVLLTGFCAVPGPRRAGVQLRHVIRALTPMHSVDLLVVREGEQGYVERQGSVRVLRVPTHEADQRSQIQAFQRALRRQLDGADYEVVHCRDSWSCMPVLESRDRLGFAVVYDLTRSPLGETTGEAELDAQYGRDEEACLLAADMILAPTPAAVKALESRGKPGRVVLSPPGVDVDRFDWDDMPAGDGPPRILYVGTLDPGRGIRVLVRAMAAIVREVDARLVLAGAMAPKFEQTLRESIRELGLTDKVEIMGPVDHDQLPALYATATVCVVPSAADLSPNPTVVYPTKLLEYMACRRTIVAARRDTVAQVVENNHEALLFDPGDPIDLARKVLRALGEPMLRDRLAANAYERVRRDLTASAARRAIRKAYEILSVRFAGQFADDSGDDAPKVEMLSDDDFEATVFEEAPAPPGVAKRGITISASEPAEVIDTSISAVRIDEALASDDDSNSGEAVVAPPPPIKKPVGDSPRADPLGIPSVEPDETMERAPVAAGALDRDARDTGGWTTAIAPPPLSEKLANKVGRLTSELLGPVAPDDWVVTTVAAVVGVRRAASTGSPVARAESIPERDDDNSDDGTPIEGVIAIAPALPLSNASFVAGEIDVPTPPPERIEELPNVEFSAVGAMLGQSETDPDTGSRTPPISKPKVIERR